MDILCRKYKYMYSVESCSLLYPANVTYFGNGIFAD